MSAITRGTASLLLGVALTALMAGSAIAGDRVRERDRLQDCSSQVAVTGESLPVEAQVRAQDRDCADEPAGDADQTQTRSQDRTCVTESCPQEPAADPTKARTRVQECVEECGEECGEAAGPQGPGEAAGPQGPGDGCEPCEPLQTQTQERAGQCGPGSDADGS